MIIFKRHKCFEQLLHCSLLLRLATLGALINVKSATVTIRLIWQASYQLIVDCDGAAFE